MIYGIGIDAVKIARIEKSIQNERFLLRCFSECERKEFENRKVESIATNFSAKEAFAKALGTGFRGLALNEISLLRDKLGKPLLFFEGRIAEKMEKLQLQAYVSVTHEAGMAVCVVVLETK